MVNCAWVNSAHCVTVYLSVSQFTISAMYIIPQNHTSNNFNFSYFMLIAFYYSIMNF